MHEKEEMGQHKVVGQGADTQPLKGDNIPDHKMFHKAPKKAKMGKKGKKKGKMKGRMLKGMMVHDGVKRKHKKGKKNPGQKRDAVGMMMKWFKKEKVAGGRKWHLIKKHNGLCKCTKRPRGRIIVSKHSTESDCENQRNGC